MNILDMLKRFFQKEEREYFHDARIQNEKDLKRIEYRMLFDKASVPIC